MLDYQDIYNRQFAKLRLSLTMACNLSCVYCVPKGFKLTRSSNELTAGEIIYLTKLLKEVASIKEVRLTGGEPLLNKNFIQILKSLAKLDFESLGLTTNAVYLLPLLDSIKNITPHLKINISLDSLDQSQSKNINGRNKLPKVLQAIQKASDLGFLLKINMVVMRGLNNNIIGDVLTFCLKHNIVCRFLEIMPLGHIRGDLFKKYSVLQPEILDVIKQRYFFEKIPRDLNSTTQYYDLGSSQKFGIIANTSQPFCEGCNRLRLSATGDVYGCISSTKGISLKPLLKLDQSLSKHKLAQILKQSMREKQNLRLKETSNIMQLIGG